MKSRIKKGPFHMQPIARHSNRTGNREYPESWVKSHALCHQKAGLSKETFLSNMSFTEISSNVLSVLWDETMNNG